MLMIAAAMIAAPVYAKAPAATPSPEARTAARMEAIKGDGAKLRMFLQAMPKGGDLHNHMGGAIYAEDWIAWAAEDKICVDTNSNRLVAPPCDAKDRVPVEGLASTGTYPRYSRVIDQLSTRGFEQGVGDPVLPGYDRFFFSFDSFGPMRGHNGKTIAATLEQAAYDHVSYVELITLPGAIREIAPTIIKEGGDGTDFAKLDAVLADLLPKAVAKGRADLDGYETEAAAINGCKSGKPGPGCGVTVRYQVSALRNQNPVLVYAALAMGMALAEADPRFVGVNIVAPEHEPVPVRDYRLHMKMFEHLHKLHPKVKLSLHAGELSLGMVPPRDLQSHIEQAVDIAGADRIGHGVDIAYEADAPALLKRMAAKRIAVEINLTSNAVILGVKGKAHPLALYRAAGVPVVLSTDDEGVSRSDMTNEYQRAVTEQGLTYPELKAMARSGLHYAFVEGASLWTDRPGGAKVAACAVIDSPACAAFAAGSAKAKLELGLERDLRRFEGE
jgi:adenosine deaminase